MKFDIHNRSTGAVQFTADINCAEDTPRSIKIGLAVKWARNNGSDLRGSDLRGSDLRWSDLRGSDLRGSDLRDSDLRGSDLHGSNLRWSDLRDSDLRGSDLHDSDLRGSNLRGSDLRWSDLRDSDLRNSLGIADRIIDGGIRSDGYRFLLTRTEPGEWRVTAGCRNYSLTDARAHWSADDYRDRYLGDEAMLIIDHMVAVAKHRGWGILDTTDARALLAQEDKDDE